VIRLEWNLIPVQMLVTGPDAVLLGYRRLMGAKAGADLGEGCRGCAPHQSVTPFLSGAPPPKKNP